MYQSRMTLRDFRYEVPAVLFKGLATSYSKTPPYEGMEAFDQFYWDMRTRTSESAIGG